MARKKKPLWTTAGMWVPVDPDWQEHPCDSCGVSVGLSGAFRGSSWGRVTLSTGRLTGGSRPGSIDLFGNA
jgi:hypothetical protein